MLLQVERIELVKYLQKSVTLRELLGKRDTLMCLDVSGLRGGGKKNSRDSTHRWLTEISTEAFSAAGYMPGEDSWFDESLTPDISITREIAPNRFDVPIDGTWFFSDLDRFAKAYSRLYSFVYCTRPRFVRNLGERLTRYLNSPWQGGYSRVNMFDALHQLIPSVHDTRIAQLTYASPGKVTIEALASVGASIQASVIAAVNKRDELKAAVGAIDGTLSGLRLKKQNLFRLSDAQLTIGAEALSVLRASTAEIAELLNLEIEIATIRSHAPNSVVTAKAAMALVTQVNRIADFQRTGMLNL